MVINFTVFGLFAGMATQSLILRHGEWDMKGPELLLSFVVLHVATLGLQLLQPESGLSGCFTVGKFG